MKSKLSIGLLSVALLTASAGIARADTLGVSCAGAVSGSNVTWTATRSGGVAPVTVQWANASTSSTQTIAYTPGTYTMTVSATDASSTVATSSCSAVVAATSSSSTAADLQARIKALLAQLEDLKKQFAQLMGNKFGAATSTKPHMEKGDEHRMATSTNMGLHKGEGEHKFATTTKPWMTASSTRPMGEWEGRHATSTRPLPAQHGGERKDGPKRSHGHDE